MDSQRGKSWRTEADLHSIRLSVAETEAWRKVAGRAEIAATLPPLREAEVAKAAEYQRLSIGRDELDREEERTRMPRKAQTQQEQIGCDMARETDLRDDATAATGRFARRSSSCKNRLMRQHHSVKLPIWGWKLPVRAPVSPMPPLPKPAPSCALRQQQELHWPIVLPI